MVKNHILLKMTGKCNATRSITYDRCSGLSIGPSTPSTRTCSSSVPRNSMRELRHIQQPNEVGVHAVEHGETNCEIPKKPKNEDIDGARRSPLRDLLEWLEECIEILLDEEASALSDAPRSILSTAPSGTFDKKGVSGKLQKNRN